MDIQIRQATNDDLPELTPLVTDLTALGCTADAKLDAGHLDRALFGAAPVAEVCVVAKGTDLIGTALYSWVGPAASGAERMTVHAFYVTPPQRGYGYGSLLIAHLARVAVASGADRLDWVALRDNAVGHLLGVSVKPAAPLPSNFIADERLRRLAARNA